MRNRTWLTLTFIIVLAVVSGWIALPGSAFDIAGIRASHPVRQGLDLQGGLQVVLQARPVAGQTLDSGTLEGTRQTLERRVNGLGVSEPLIQTRGSDQIIVELPGVDDPQEAVGILQQTALLEIIDPLGQYLPPGTVVNTTLGPADDALGAESPGSEATPAATPEDATPVATPVAATPVDDARTPNGPVYETIISGAELKNAYVTTGNTGMNQVVGFELQGDAASRFFQYTSSHLGQPMSIVIDKQVISSPTINGAISTQGIIEGVPPTEVDDLVIQLKAGALGVPLDVIQSRTVGPTLGQDSIERSILAGVIGLGTVALFMIFYYRVPGLVSVIALLIYTAVVFAIFKLVPVTLTLAGIAGFILSIGMAVDANVLIFARIKEELHQGRSLTQSVESGFAHAWPSIRDSNITTMITTFILYLFGNYTGTSIITGFALTLFIGVVVSMFTAITVTRTLLRVLVALGLSDTRWWFGANVAESSTPAVATQ
ncbi:MAG TPA: protein translocase subunit SecD [Thermomicrobiales bacterium]|nr:protein translocase subunit SecD [Thermomicrobiales bacterium]